MSVFLQISGGHQEKAQYSSTLEMKGRLLSFGKPLDLYLR